MRHGSRGEALMTFERNLWREMKHPWLWAVGLGYAVIIAVLVILWMCL